MFRHLTAGLPRPFFRFVIGPLAALIFGALFCPQQVLAQRQASTWLVRFELPALPADLSARIQNELQKLALPTKIEPLALPAALMLNLPRQVDEAFLRAVLATLAPIRHLEPNLRWQPVVEPDDPLFDQQWGLSNTGQKVAVPEDVADNPGADCDSNADGFCDVDPGVSGIDTNVLAAWEKTVGSSSGAKIKVAVIDSGIAKDHPDFNPASGSKIWRQTNNALAGTAFAAANYGWDACNGDGEPEDDIGHGTQVAGVIAAEGNDGLGIAGVVWDVELIPVKFLAATPVIDDPHCGKTSAAIEALEFARLAGAQVVNMSWGGAEGSEFLLEKLEELAAANIVLVAAAGNDGESLADAPFYPASYSIAEMISVAAHTNNGQLASFSNYGGVVAIAAPGAAIATDQGAWDDLWNGANFADIDGGADPALLSGPIGGTNFSAAGGNNRWGKFGFTDGTNVLLGDLEAACPEFASPSATSCGEQTAHSANIDSTLTAESINAAVWGSAVFKYVLAYDLGSGAQFNLQYSSNDGASWNDVETAQYTGYHSYYEYRIDFGSILDPLPSSLAVRFVFTTAAAHDGDNEFPIYGGVQLFDVAWLKPSSDFSNAVILSQGTSLAAPFVAGAAALVRDVYPDLDAAAVVQHLLDTAASGSFGGRVLDNARLDIGAAVGAEPAEPVTETTQPNTSATSNTEAEEGKGGGGCGCRAGDDLGGLRELASTVLMGALGVAIYRRRFSRARV